MLQQLLRNAAVYGLTTVVARGLALALLPVLTHVFSPTDYGKIEILTIFATVVQVIIALEIGQGLGRQLADTEDPRERSLLASTALWFTLAAYSTFVIAGLLAAPVLADTLFGSRVEPGLVRVALLAVWANGLFYLGHALLRWELRPRSYAVAVIVFAATYAAATLVFVVALDAGVAGVFLGQLVGYLAGAATALYLGRDRFGLAFDLGRWRAMVAFSLPLVPSSVAVVLAAYIDRIVLTAVLSVAAAGVYAVGFRLASMVGLLMVGFQGALTPLVLARYRDPSTPGDLARIFRYFSALALALFVLLAVFAGELLVVLTTERYYGAVVAIPLLVPALMLAGMYIFAPGLIVAKRTRLFGAVNLGTMALNLALSLLLVPAWGIRGAAVAALVASSAGFAAFMVASQRAYPVPHAWGRLGAALAVAVAAVAGQILVGGEEVALSALAVAAKAALVATTVLVIGRVLVDRGELRGLRRRLGLLGGSQA